MTNKKITPEMVLAKLTDKPKIQADIARELECYRSTPAKYLKQLEHEGVAKQTPDGWIRAEGRKAQNAKPVVVDVAQRSDIVTAMIAKAVEDEIVDRICDPDEFNGTHMASRENAEDAAYVHRVLMAEILREMHLATPETIYRDEILDENIDYAELEQNIKRIELHAKAAVYLEAYAKAIGDEEV